MKEVALDYVWTNPYIVFDEFFEPEEFETVKSGFGDIDRRFNPRRGFLVLKCAFDLSGRCVYNTTRCTEDKLRPINERLATILLNVLGALAPHKLEQARYVDWGFQTTPKSLGQSIHPDIPEKLLSAVVYCKPEENLGTFLFSSQAGGDRFEVPWKPNRALIFSKAEDTWHSYRCNATEQRCALVLNVMSKVDPMEPG
ncbi:MAG: hypothetical protein OXI11_07010 [Gammaproteobacteria bacterium]|nr:hypothetical protein [Gammaproteobacteria bacterium]MXW46303.1 hypothetical protein [Gammaproteobacteria bacterium]MYD00946.1 hypothetical protein [Gammaproteobacteria bacterium]MYI25040.1 hypothetical protein [Gammaproteobacteria bacterium]